MADSGSTLSGQPLFGPGKNWYLYLIVLLFAGAIYVGCIVSPPSLMDDVDSVQAQIARNMLVSGDWVTARLDGVPYLEKPPLIYWTIALSYKIFGVHDWSARIPMALSALALCWVTAAFGVWAFGKRAGFYAGLCISTCVGLFLFTRVLIPDVMLTFTTALAMWAFLRAIDADEPHPRLWAFLFAASLGVGLLLKSLIAIVFPVGAAIVYLLIPRQFFSWQNLETASSLHRRAHHPARSPRPGTSSPRCAIRRISCLRCTAAPIPITDSSGSFSSTSSFSVFSIFVTRAITTPSRVFTSGYST